MEILDRLLTRASAGKLPAGAKPQGSFAAQFGSVIQRIAQPSSVMRILFYRNGELLRDQCYDPHAQKFFQDSSAAEVTVRQVAEFMRDSFQCEGDSSGYVIGSHRVIGLFEGPYTLVVVAKADTNETMLQMWMRHALKNLRAEFNEG